MLDRIENRRAQLTVAIIDACRDNPFHGNGTGQGLFGGLKQRPRANDATIPGTFIVFAAEILRAPSGGTVHAVVIGVNHYGNWATRLSCEARRSTP